MISFYQFGKSSKNRFNLTSCSFISNARDLASSLQEIAKMHRANVNHTDLNIHNILIDDQDKVRIIDFDKCFSSTDTKVSEENLERLLRSFKKEKGKCAIAWKLQDVDCLLSSYHQSNKG